MEYYDLILTGISASLITGVSIGLATPLSLNLAAGLGAIVASAFMYHGMFQNAPITTHEAPL